MDMNAILKFPKRIQAEQFSLEWGRRTKKGHTLGAGLINVEVTLFDISEDEEEWINKYVNNISNIET